MTKFYFQAVTTEGKQISGHIEAENLEAARGKLGESKLSILTLEEKTDQFSTTKEGFSVFQFEGLNDQHKTVKGTIEAIDRYAAYKKLRVSYKLEVFYLVEKNLDAAQKAQLQKQGIEKELEDKLIMELRLEERKNSKKKKRKKSDTNAELKKAVESNEKERQFIVDKIDGVLAEVVPLLEENSEYIDPNKKREIETRIDLLVRLKHSNSVDHLKSLTKKLLTQISEDEIFLQDANIPEELKEEINRRKNQFQAIGGKFDKLVGRGMLNIEDALAQIDVNEFAWFIRHGRIIEKITTLFYSFILWLGLLISVLLLFYIAQYIFDSESITKSLWAGSPVLWYFWGLCALIGTSFYFVRLNPRKSWWDNLSVGASYTVLAIVYTVQFPVLFFWTQ